MKGTIQDFLILVAETPELAQKLAALASEFDFEFSEEGMSEEELDQVSGGVLYSSSFSRYVQMTSSLTRTIHDIQMTSINNLK